MERIVVLKKVFGEEYLRLELMADDAFINAQWSGVQSVETVMEGGNKILEMIKESGCSKLLNSNKNVIGSWDLALEWAENEWAPGVREAGLRYLAQVVPSSYYAAMTIESLLPRIDGNFEIRTFEEDKDAEAWLLSV
ncbi:hypothetical protein [Adhaeribacter terreus]|uniref:STAS/SEC14 domain-containing protein n=1 Tax=Adhaeribacter terreus TaxID=529703 RepID=A0ABW0EDB4_9BACT